MKPRYERLNERLEGCSWSASSQSVPPPSAPDPEVDELVALARRLPLAPLLQVRPDFAGQLERSLLLGNAKRRRQRTVRGRSLPSLMQAYPLLWAAIILGLLLLIVGTGAFVAVAQVTNPDSPLYTLKNWEKGLQIPLFHAPDNSQAEWDLRVARERLTSLADLAIPARAASYRWALMNLEQQITTAAETIAALPAGTNRQHLLSELASLTVDTRNTLHRLLPQLAVPERLVTTEALGQFGDEIPSLNAVEVDFPTHPNGQVTIRITGTDIQAGAQMLIDGQMMQGEGTFHNGVSLFTVTWRGDQHPQSIGILNPDGTAVQTTTMILQNATGNGTGEGTSNTKGSGNSNGHGNGAGKPSVIPTPHH